MTETNGQRKQTLRDWRRSLGLSQRELAELVGTGESRISNLENGYANLDSPSGRRVMKVLDLRQEQILPPEPPDALNTFRWEDDGFSLSAPRQELCWWRERRAMTRMELGALAGINPNHLMKIEGRKQRGVQPSTRRKLAMALKVAPDKLIFPGDNVKPTNEQGVDGYLREELRGARKALRLTYDFLREDPNIAFRALEQRDKVLEVVMREIRGT